MRRVREDAGSIAHDDARRTSGREVDVIVADPEIREHAAAHRGLADDGGIEAVGDRAQECIRLAQRGVKLQRRERAIGRIRPDIEAFSHGVFDSLGEPTGKRHHGAVHYRPASRPRG